MSAPMILSLAVAAVGLALFWYNVRRQPPRPAVNVLLALVAVALLVMGETR